MVCVDAARLRRSVVRRFVAAAVVCGLMLFGPAGTLRYWQAWVYLALLFSLIAGIVAHFLKHDPEVLERRMRTREKFAEQRLIMKLSLVVFFAPLVVPAFDRRCGWSSVPVAVVLAADALVVLAYAFFFLVLRENRYASRIVEIAEGQRVVTTGPYAIVRHPMYLAGLVLYAASPVALGSWWGLVASALLPISLVARILHEEKVLLAGLSGYREYTARTRWRLIPGVW